MHAPIFIVSTSPEYAKEDMCLDYELLDLVRANCFLGADYVSDDLDEGDKTHWIKSFFPVDHSNITLTGNTLTLKRPAEEILADYRNKVIEAASRPIRSYGSYKSDINRVLCDLLEVGDEAEFAVYEPESYLDPVVGNSSILMGWLKDNIPLYIVDVWTYHW